MSLMRTIEMFKISASICVLVLLGSLVHAAECQSKAIASLDKFNYWPQEMPLEADINSVSGNEVLLINLRGDWITLEFYDDQKNWQRCSPNLTLKILDTASEEFINTRGWNFFIETNAKGSIRTHLCFYGGSRGFCHPKFNLVLRYLGDKMQIIGFDRSDFGITYSAVDYSINLLTGQSVVTKTPGISQSDAVADENGIIAKKEIKYDFNKYFINGGEAIYVPDAIDEVVSLLYRSIE